MIEGIEIEIGHEIGFYKINRLSHPLQEFIKVFFVQENFMPVVTVFIKSLPALGNR